MEEATLMEQAPTTPNEGEQTSETEQNNNTSQQSEQSQAEGEQQEQQGAPEKYEFKPMEGQEFDPKFVEAYSEVAKELNLTQDAAQKMIDKISPVIQKSQMDRIEAVRTEWAEQSKSDKEFGGDKLNENLGIAKQALDKFGTPELKELINKSGLGNNPEMIRFFYRAGKAITQDNFVGGHKEGKASGPMNFNDLANALYTT